MFTQLAQKFEGAWKRLSGSDRLTESNVREALADVRTALLEADVEFAVAERFCAKVGQAALGTQVLQGVEPGQQFVKCVHDELVRLLGGERALANAEKGDFSAPEPILNISPGPTIIMLAGLQGSGKTTTAGKLALHLAGKGRKVMLAACDLQRPAAVAQLRTLAGQAAATPDGLNKVLFFGQEEKCAAYGQAVGVAVEVAQAALAEARAQKCDTLILDTAGRLHINAQLMEELKQVAGATRPHHVWLVLDAMTGQDAVRSAKAFDDQLELDGIVLSKFDSDARGGAALSVREVTGRPLRFVGTSEKLDGLEPFHPARAAQRILGMGDVVSLVEKAQAQVSEQEAADMEAKMLSGRMNLEDFLDQMKKMRRMGSLKSLMGMLPGMGGQLDKLNIDEKQMDRTQAIVLSMTVAERRRPETIDTARRRRIARGAGVKLEEVNAMLKNFEMMKMMTSQMAQLTKSGAMASLAGRSPKELEKLARSGQLAGMMKAPAAPVRKFKERKR